MNKSETVTKLAAALCKAQAEMPAAEMNARNPFLKNKYADLGSIIETAKPVLAKYGLSYAQMPVGGGDQVGITTTLMHDSGEWLESTILLPLLDEKGKSAAQVAGSVITYLRRYSLASMLGIYADEDTDGNVPQTSNKRTSTKPPASNGKMTLATAEKVKNSEGVEYGSLDTEVLSHMANALLKSLGEAEGDKRDQLQLKLDAAQTILAARAAK